MAANINLLFKNFPQKDRFTCNSGHLPRQTVNWKLSKVPLAKLLLVAAVWAWATENGTVSDLEII